MKIIDKMYGASPGRLIMPDDYLTGDPMPLIIQTEGIGQHRSDGTLNKLDALYDNNTSLARCRDGFLNNVIEPYSGKAYRFAVLSLQGSNSTPVFPAELEAAITQTIAAYKIDTTRIYSTGLSIGGAIVVLSIQQPGNRYAAAVAMSMSGYQYFPDWKTNRKAKIWCIHGKDDGGGTPPSNSLYTVNTVWDAVAGDSHYTEVTGGHCCWDRQYDPACRQDINGKQMNIYEWMLSKVSFSDSGTGRKTAVTPPVVVPPVTTVQKGVTKTITVWNDGSIDVK